MILPEFCFAKGEIRKGRLVKDRKLNIACIGCGGKGQGDVHAVGGENIVALCDVDAVRAGETFGRFPNVKKYKDFRQMLIEMDDQIDAVTVSTPDHTHFPAAMMAIEMGKHVFVQKPLTHTVWEARELALAARKHGVVTQMGNQGHAGEGTRLLREWIQAGVIGPVREVHAWINHPGKGGRDFLSDRPKDTPPVPEGLDWNRWLGVAPARPYHPAYVPFKWRGWWDFGSCCLGDMGCHVMDAAFWALDLKYPASVEAEAVGANDETGPDWSIVTYQFPARGHMPPAKVVWYDGGKKPPRPKDLEEERPMSQHGQLLLGDRGTILDSGAYCDSPKLIPRAKMREFLPKRPPKTIPRVKGGPHKEWIRACKGGPKPGSNFEHSGPLTEMVLLGSLAIRTGKKIEWDGENMRCTNVPEVNKLVRKMYRKF